MVTDNEALSAAAAASPPSSQQQHAQVRWLFARRSCRFELALCGSQLWLCRLFACLPSCCSLRLRVRAWSCRAASAVADPAVLVLDGLQLLARHTRSFAIRDAFGVVEDHIAKW